MTVCWFSGCCFKTIVAFTHLRRQLLAACFLQQVLLILPQSRQTRNQRADDGGYAVQVVHACGSIAQAHVGLVATQHLFELEHCE